MNVWSCAGMPYSVNHNPVTLLLFQCLYSCQRRSKIDNCTYIYLFSLLAKIIALQTTFIHSGPRRQEKQSLKWNFSFQQPLESYCLPEFDALSMYNRLISFNNRNWFEAYRIFREYYYWHFVFDPVAGIWVCRRVSSLCVRRHMSCPHRPLTRPVFLVPFSRDSIMDFFFFFFQKRYLAILLWKLSPLVRSDLALTPKRKVYG